jgi:cyclophilin family peptidyl-prolyl cis-trans isomerase
VRLCGLLSPDLRQLKDKALMNKFLTANVLAVGLALSLTGCNADQTPAGSPTTAVVTNTQVSVTTTPAAQTEAPVTATPMEATSSPAPAAEKTPSAEKTPGKKGSAKKPDGSSPPEEAAGKPLLEPFPGTTAPALKKVVKVKFKTDLGDILIDVYPEAAPNAAKRFEELVTAGFYDNTPIFRIVPNFVAQFGINSDPKFKHYKEDNFNDDPSYFKLAKGTLAFAKSGVNHNSTQVFIDYNDNSQLRAQGFTAFAAIAKGEELTTQFKQVGDPSMGVSQDALWQDTQGTLKSLPVKPNMIIKAEIVK